MSSNFSKKHLVILVADKDMEMTISSLLRRYQALGIHQITFDIFKHPGHDGACRVNGPDFLRNFNGQYNNCLLIFDWEGSGENSLSPDSLESELESQLTKNGWLNNNAVIVIQPELESWVWTPSKKVDRILGWDGKIPSLRNWMISQNYLQKDEVKPERPKEAFRASLFEVRKPVSASLFKKLAENVSFKECEDRAFLKLINILKNWFPK